MLSQYFPPVIYDYDYIQSIETNIKSIVLPNWTCNHSEYTQFDFSRFVYVESIEIGSDSFSSVKVFKINKLEYLKYLIIGINSFTEHKNGIDGSSESKSFHILNCKSLKLIEIGKYSFSDFGGEFELKNLPKLYSIQIGKIGINSYNFYKNSFIIRSKYNELAFHIIDLPQLTYIELGNRAFEYSVSTIIESMKYNK